MKTSYDKKILAIREKMNMSQEEIAYRLGTSRMSIYRWENGQPIRSRAHIKAIEKLYKKVVNE